MTFDSMQDAVFITGGAGFIGSAFARKMVEAGRTTIVLDALTYAGRKANLVNLFGGENFYFLHGDICDAEFVRSALERYRPVHLVHFAAETHVDRSIENADRFIATNVIGTQILLDAALDLRDSLRAADAEAFRFVHVSTDEVFGSLGSEGTFNEDTPYAPRSPYSASKAAADHLVAAWGKTFGLPVITTYCTNNYGPRQQPEKLIPHLIASALDARPLPIYGDGTNVRDWLHVDDHCAALERVVDSGVAGRTYCIGGQAERSNLAVAQALADILDDMAPRDDGRSYRDRITFVQDRPGHDPRYAMDISRISSELDWRPSRSFDAGLRDTVAWYLDNRDWWRSILDENRGAVRLGLRRRR